jgi:DNA segregation ATPase FtsK/SpoIIIE, S-DNA-T family
MKKAGSSLFIREIWAVLFALLGVFIWITLWFPDSTGIVGHGLKVLLGYTVGWAAWGIPVFFLALAGSLIAGSIKIKTGLLHAIIGSMGLSVCMDMWVSGEIIHWVTPRAFVGGGWIGGTLSYLLQKLLGFKGTWILLVGLILMAMMVLFGFTIKGFLHWITHLFRRGDELVELPKKAAKPESSKKVKVDPELKKWVAQEDTPVDDIEPEIMREPEAIPDPAIDITEHEPAIVAHTQVEPSSPTPDTFALPSLDLLEPPQALQSLDTKAMKQKRQESAKVLEETLASFQVEAKVVHITPGPSVTRYELQPGSGVKISKITSLNKDIALKLAVPDVRIEAPIPGKALIGIEVPNTDVQMIVMRNLIDQGEFFSHPSKLLCSMGLTITGESVFMDLSKMPHVLIAGATGAGKSVCVNAIILSILMRATPDEVKFLMIDPKKVELSLYEGIPHLLAPVVTNPHKAAATLKQWALFEMERRYDMFSQVGVKDIAGYNKWATQNEGYLKLPYIVVIIDELADLMMVAAQDVESTICRLAQMSRATGIHLVIATQRPSVNVITGLIKANVPSRISFFLQSQIDSRTILDAPGAEKLLGKGDMLYSPVGSFKPRRVQGIFVSEREVKRVVHFLKAQGGPQYVEEIISVDPTVEDKKNSDSDDELFEAAKEIVQNQQNPSTSYLQRKLRIGYNRAARLMEELTEKGFVVRSPDKS